MAVGALLVSVLLAANHVAKIDDNKSCTTVLIQAATKLLVCVSGNNVQAHLPEVINNTMTPEDMVNKLCNEMNAANCMRNYASETKDCFDDKHRAGLQVGIKVLDTLQSFTCTDEERQILIDEVKTQPYCMATGNIAEKSCGVPDIIGFVHPFDKEGCAIMKKQFDCIESIAKLSELCTNEALSNLSKISEMMYDATPCGDQKKE